MSDLKYDNRRSGRTSKMLLAAAKHAASVGSKAYVVLATGDMSQIGPILAKIDPRGAWCQHDRTFLLSDGGKMVFCTMKNPNVKMDGLFLTGAPEGSVFFDHEAVRLAHNRIISEFHRYD